MLKTLKFGFLCAALAILAVPAIAQNECQLAGLYSIPSFQVVDSVGKTHQGACWNATAVAITLPLTSSSAGSLGATVTIPAGGTTFTPLTGSAVQLKAPPGDSLDVFVGTTDTFTTPGIFIDDPTHSSTGVVITDSIGDELVVNPGGPFAESSGLNEWLLSNATTNCGAELTGGTNEVLYVGPQASCGAVPATAGLYSVDAASDTLSFAAGLFQISVPVNATKYQTATNCAVNSVSPAACGSAAAGAVVVPNATITYTVSTTAVTAASRIFLFPMGFAGNLPGTPTCVAYATTSPPLVSAISAGVSFTFTLATTVGQTCWQYWIVN